MSEERWLNASDGWLRRLLRLYPTDFRDEMGTGFVETYRDRCRAAYRGGGGLAVGGVWLRALADSLRNGLGEHARSSVDWRRSGNWGATPNARCAGPCGRRRSRRRWSAPSPSASARSPSCTRWSTRC